MKKRTLLILLLAAFLLALSSGLLIAREMSPQLRILGLIHEVEEVLAHCPKELVSNREDSSEELIERRFELKAAQDCLLVIRGMFPRPVSLQNEISGAFLRMERSTWVDFSTLDRKETSREVDDYKEAYDLATRMLAAFKDLIERQDEVPTKVGSRHYLCDFDDQVHGLDLPDGNVCLAASLIVKSFFTKGSFDPSATDDGEEAVTKAIEGAFAGEAVTINGFPSLTAYSQKYGDMIYEKCKGFNQEANGDLNGFLGLKGLLGNHHHVAKMKGWDDKANNERVYERIIDSIKRGEPQVLAFVSTNSVGEKVVHAVMAHEVIEFDNIVRIKVWDPNTCVLGDYKTEFRYNRLEKIFSFVTHPMPQKRSGRPEARDAPVAKVFLPEGTIWRESNPNVARSLVTPDDISVGWNDVSFR